MLARTTVQHVTPLELQVPELQDQMKEFDIALRERLSDSNFVISGMEETSGFYLPDIYDIEEFADSVTVPRDGDETEPEQDSFTPEGSGTAGRSGRLLNWSSTTSQYESPLRACSLLGRECDCKDLECEIVTAYYKILLASSFTPKGYDSMINAEIMIPKGNGMIVGKVIKRAKGEDGNPIGLRNSNPLLDTREYEVLMPDGATVSYTGRESLFTG